MRPQNIIKLFAHMVHGLVCTCMSPPNVKMLKLPGGALPERQTEGAAGYDVRIRALVHITRMDPNDPRMRETIFDFEKIPEDEKIASHVREEPREDGKGTELVYVLYPGERVVVGIGFLAEMDPTLLYHVLNRSGLAIRRDIVVTDRTVVDSDYRGEAGIRIRNDGTEPFVLRRGMRIAQIIYQNAVFPKIKVVTNPADISTTKRGAGGLGSTGLL